MLLGSLESVPGKGREKGRKNGYIPTASDIRLVADRSKIGCLSPANILLL